MGRPRKRKRPASVAELPGSGPALESAASPAVIPAPRRVTHTPAPVQHAVLSRYYTHLLTLRDYILSRLPRSSKIRKRKIAAVGRPKGDAPAPLSAVEQSLADLLDRTLIGLRPERHGSEDGRWEKWTTFTQRADDSYVTLSDGIAGSVFSQSEVVDFVIWLLFYRVNRDGAWPKHMLCDGFRRNRTSLGAAQAPRGDRSIPGIFMVQPNHHVDALRKDPWPQLLMLLGQSGERLMMDLLIDCAVFTPVHAGANNFCQISGRPLADTELLPVGETEPKTDKSPSDISFVRSRMFYCRAALNARGLVHFGLRHIHVLNRSQHRNPDEGHEQLTEEQESSIRRQNTASTVRVMMYIFPRQFGLHNVFTSTVDPKETTQRVKDYTLREDEIATRFGNLSEQGTRLDLPKRLRSSARDLVRKLQILHQRCSYSSLLRYFCPVSSEIVQRVANSGKHRRARKAKQAANTQSHTQEAVLESVSVRRGAENDSLTGLATAPSKVSAFCQASLSKIVPNEFWGTGEVAEHNKGAFLRKVHDFICLRRYEAMSLHEVAQGMKIEQIAWLAPQPLLSNKMSQTDTRKRLELFFEFLYFLFDSIVMPLVRNNFYVTESNSDKYRLFYFRHDVWRHIAEPAMAKLKTSMFEEVDLAEARRILDRRSIGFSQVRLLPKGASMRPIMNLRRRAVVQGNQRKLGLAINKVLAPAQAILKLESDTNPTKLGSSMFSVSDIYGRIKAFKTSLADLKIPMYFAKVDVKAAFDTVPQAAIIGLLNSIPQRNRYHILRYLEVGTNFSDPGAAVKGARPKPARRWPMAAVQDGGVSRLQQVLEQERIPKRKNTVFAEAFSKRCLETSEVLQLIGSHIQQNLVKIGKKFYRQKEGIPQGSVLSSTLCNYFYADLEHQVLPFLESADCLLLRLIDDFLLITTDRGKAARFVRTMHGGVPEYGVVVNGAKTLVNFELEAGDQAVPRLDPGQKFPYCGTLIDCSSLDIARARDRNRGKVANMYGSLTVEYSRAPGQSFQRKVMNAFKIQSHLMFFDAALNSAGTIRNNLRQALADAAAKMWAYDRCLPGPKRPSPELIIRTIAKLADLAYILLASRTRKLRYPGYVCDVKKAEVSWLTFSAFRDVLAGKQSRYTAVLAWLRAELAKLSTRREIRRGRLGFRDAGPKQA